MLKMSRLFTNVQGAEFQLNVLVYSGQLCVRITIFIYSNKQLEEKKSKTQNTTKDKICV